MPAGPGRATGWRHPTPGIVPPPIRRVTIAGWPLGSPLRRDLARYLTMASHLYAPGNRIQRYKFMSTAAALIDQRVVGSRHPDSTSVHCCTNPSARSRDTGVTPNIAHVFRYRS